MTREELKEHCKRQIQQFERVEKIMPVTPNDWKRYEEHKLILELLEQEPILDKIRAEILKISSYKGFELGCVKDGYRIAMVNVLNIIDKYRAESGDLGVVKNEWIYRTLPPEGVDFDKIEKALGFKLFIWQKTFITRGVFRQYGETTARCIRRLLQKDNPIDYRMRIVHGQELFERMEMVRIHDQLQAAGVEVCEILRSERRKHET